MDKTVQSKLSISICDVEDDTSMLNNNVDFSGSDMELTAASETTMERGICGKLSITLDEEERKLLKKFYAMDEAEKSAELKKSNMSMDIEKTAPVAKEQMATSTITFDITDDATLEEDETTEPTVNTTTMSITDDATLEENETTEPTLNITDDATLEEDETTEPVVNITDDATLEENETTEPTANIRENSALEESQTKEKIIEQQNSSIDAGETSVVANNEEQSNKFVEETTPQANNVTCNEAIQPMEVSQEEEEEEEVGELIDTIDYNYEANYFKTQLFELGRRCWTSTPETQNYTKGCLWSPDGTCLLVPVHLDGMHVIELPLDLYEIETINDDTRELSPLKSAVHVPEGGTVYDCIWYPLMNSTQPDTCIWLATRQHEPIQLWDAFDGRLRGTYSGYDAVDEVETAISLNFSSDGEKIYAGYKKNIKIFDTSRPGRIYDTFPVKRAISCIAVNAENTQTLTCGNWHGYIQHYDLRSPKLGALFTLGGHSGGITHLQYAGTDNKTYLISGARKDNKLLLWDMRNYNEPISTYDRSVATNQRIYFDLSPQQQWLVSGDTQGLLRIWPFDATNACDHADSNAITLPLHGDCLNGVNFHPTRPILATSSGQYHFFNDNETSIETPEATDANMETLERIVDYENALLLLWCGNIA